ncbi:hypothetical protein ACLOJK_013286 [Asimina triloba]
MDSGNSGSMQSSSGGGDEEYDSRAEPFSAFLNSTAQISGPMLSPPLASSHHHHSSLFDPLANYFDAFPRSPPPPPSTLNSLSNLDMGWPRGPRSDPSSTNMAGGLVAPPSSSSTPTSLGAGPMASNRIPYNPLNPSPISLPSDSNDGCASAAAIDQPNPTRNPKKRSRASRRAPTTVLTTDTSNFRAMVQEFTGIPAPPFSASTFPRSRLDLFTSPSTMRLGLSDPTPPYLLRPFVQKVPPHHPSFPSIPLGSSSSSPLTSPSSTVPDLVTSTSTTTNGISAFGNAAASSTSATAASNAIPTNNYQLLADLGLPKQNQSLPNMNNPIFNFQSPPKYQLANLAAFGSKSSSQFQPSMNADSQLRMGTLDGFSMSHGPGSSQQGSLSSFIASEAMPSRSADPPPRWGADGAGPSNGDEEQLRPFNANHGGSQQRVSSCKLNYNASSTSDFNAEKGPDNVQPRGEGMVDSWICSSD